MSGPDLRRRIAIVGGGASGSIVAMNALRLAPDGCEVILIEKRSEIGRGLAYSTPEADHRLNVRASNMSVFSDDSSHFTRWLSDGGMQTTNFDHFYAPRGTYGDYVADTLKGVAQANGSLRIVNETALSVLDRGNGVAIRLADGSNLEADVVVLATGHEEAAPPDRPYAMRLGGQKDTDLDPDAPVMILGHRPEHGRCMADA